MSVVRSFRTILLGVTLLTVPVFAQDWGDEDTAVADDSGYETQSEADNSGGGSSGGSGVPGQSYRLKTSLNPPSAGSIYLRPNNDSYPYGTKVFVRANPAGKYSFTNWSGALNSENREDTVTITEDMTLTANFTRPEKTSSKSGGGSGGGSGISYSGGFGLSSGFGWGFGKVKDTESSDLSMFHTNVGAHLFFDATYVSVSFGYFSTTDTYAYDNVIYVNIDNPKLTISGWDLGVYLKYPFETLEFDALGIDLTLFPILGFEYNIASEGEWKFWVLKEKIKGDKLSSMWLLLGVGGDIDIADKIFVRSELFLLKYNTLSKYEDDNFKDYLKMGHTVKASFGFKL